MVRNHFHIYILAGALIAGAGLSPAATLAHGGDNRDFNNLTGESQTGLFRDTGAAWEDWRLSAKTGSAPISITTDIPAAYTELVESDCKPPSVPEPSTAALAGIGVALVGLGVSRWKL